MRTTGRGRSGGGALDAVEEVPGTSHAPFLGRSCLFLLLLACFLLDGLRLQRGDECVLRWSSDSMGFAWNMVP